MAERDMTGRERPEEFTELPADPDAAPGLSRRRGGDEPRFGHLGPLEGAGLVGVGGSGGDLANLPPWSARGDETRPDRDPVALAAWRRVAEMRRRRAAGGSEPDVHEEAEDADLAPVDPVVLDASVLPAPDDELGELADMPASDTDDDSTESTDTDVATDADDADRAPFAPPTAATEPAPEDSPVTSAWESPAAGPGPSRRPDGPPPVRDGGPTPARPTGPRPERPGPGGRHEVLLALAGRIDDDALASVRELVAVEDDAAAAELLGGCLLAAGAGLTPREHSVLGGWFASARVDPELVDALPRDPEADRRVEHRFVAEIPVPVGPGSAATTPEAGEAVARAAARLPGVTRVRECWRTTPAGSAPGPVPHRVVLVEARTADACEHVAHHVAHAARGMGAVSVEVFAADADLPAYHRAAARAARPLGDGGEVGDAGDTVSNDESLSVPPFGVTAGPGAGARNADAAGMSLLAATGMGPAPATRSPFEPPEQFHTVADAGRDPLERAEDHRPPAPSAPAAATPAPDPEPEVLDPETTAERIAALWRTPPPDEILTAGLPEPDRPPFPAPPIGGVPSPVDDDPDAVTGDIPIVRDPVPPAATGERAVLPDPITPEPSPPDTPPFGAPSAPSAPAATEGVVRRGRHGRAGETGEFDAVATPAPTERPRPRPTPRPEEPATEAAEPAPYTNGHHHGPGHSDGPGDAVTGPVSRPPAAGAETGRETGREPGYESGRESGYAPDAPGVPGPDHPPAPTPAERPRGADSIDSQLSDRERELLARLHEELASRERLTADAPDPLTGRPPGDPPAGPTGPVGPPSGDRRRPPAPPPSPPWPGPVDPGTNGHVNGHGLPRRGDPEAE